MKPASLLPFVLLALAFWLLVIRPGQRARAAKAALISTLQPGAQVVTSSGMRGTVVEIEDDDVLLEIAEGVRVHFVTSAIAAVKAAEDHDADDADDEADEDDHEEAAHEADDLPDDEAADGRPKAQHDRTEHSALTESSDPSEPTT